jgi:hypothetical protein
MSELLRFYATKYVGSSIPSVKSNIVNPLNSTKQATTRVSSINTLTTGIFGAFRKWSTCF